MGAALYLSFLLLLLCLSRAARSQLRDDPYSIDPRHVPGSVYRAVHRAARGIAVTEVRVDRHGAAGVRYLVSGLMPDGRALELDVLGDGTVYRRDRKPAAAAPPLPDAVNRRLRQSLPSFRPTAGAVRLVSGEASLWYEIDGLGSDDQPASLRISPDGRAFHMIKTRRPA